MSASIIGKVHSRYRQLGWQGLARYSIMRAIDLGHDYAFDFLHSVNTRGVSLPIIEGAQGYKGSLPRLVRGMLSRLRIPYEQYTFVDLGSGKGRTLLIASEYPFRRVIGVEYVPEINTLAQANIARYRGKRKCRTVESICGDARDFVFPNEPLLVYFYNPFREALMASVLGNLRRSLEESPRPAIVIYMRPVFVDVLDRCGFLEPLATHRSPLIENFNYAIYRSTMSCGSFPAPAAPR